MRSYFTSGRAPVMISSMAAPFVFGGGDPPKTSRQSAAASSAILSSRLFIA
jgi:hypothetical protein